jgi:glycosyltransferase involved in cell wall biosynthesis
MKKIAIIAQRYGLEVNGGAEYHARVLAEQLHKENDVEVLSTTAISYGDWKSEYPVGDSLINNVPVKRFFSHTKNHKKFRITRRIILKNRKDQRVLKKIKINDFVEKHITSFEPTDKDNTTWLIEQGPYCPDLVDYLKKNKDNYDCFIFFTYLYYPTAIGMKEVAEKSIFIPTAHDEPLLYTPPYKELFDIPKFIMYNTQSEKELVEKTFPNCTKNSDIAGVGIEKHTLKDDVKLPDEFNYDFPFFLYIGRIDSSKGCIELFNDFNEYVKKQPNVKLILIGKNFTDLQPTENIIFTGFVDEEVKYHILKQCKALIIPSKYESLSLVTLEAMIQGKIVIANKACEVLKNHIDKSNSGFYYHDNLSLTNTLDTVLNIDKHEYLEHMRNAEKYVEDNYTWKQVLSKFDNAINFIKEQNL